MRLIGPSTAACSSLLLAAPLLIPSNGAGFLSSPSSSYWNSSDEQPSVTSSESLLPPFNASDSRLVAQCARRAQLKQRRNQSRRLDAGGWSLWTRLGMDSQPKAEPPPLSGLPIRQVRYEHVHRQGALFCRTGSWLELSGDPVQVRGTRRHSGRFSIFQFLAVAFGLVSIRARASQHFLCMDSRGQLYAAPESRYSAECVFMEEMHPQVYNMYSSCAHGHPKRPWFLALSRTGRPRRGKYTRRGQKSAHFVLVEESGDGGRVDGPLDSLGHAESRADWLVHWRNFYEVHRHRRKRPPTPKKPSLRWNISDGIAEVRRRRGHSQKKV